MAGVFQRPFDGRDESLSVPRSLGSIGRAPAAALARRCFPSATTSAAESPGDTATGRRRESRASWPVHRRQRAKRQRPRRQSSPANSVARTNGAADPSGYLRCAASVSCSDSTSGILPPRDVPPTTSRRVVAGRDQAVEVPRMVQLADLFPRLAVCRSADRARRCAVVANRPAVVPKADAPKPSKPLPGSAGPFDQAFDCGS